MRAIWIAIGLCLSAAAQAELVELKWTGGAFSHKANIAPKKFLEVCGRLKKGEAVKWRFSSGSPTDFDIHYHVGNDVVYPENQRAVSTAAGTLVVPLDQDLCWMWSNKTAQPAEIELQLTQAGNPRG